MKFVNSAVSICVPASRCSLMPIEVASIAQAAKPASAKRLKPACTVTGPGVVMPVNVISDGCNAEGGKAPASRGLGGSPTPSVPITPQRRPSALNACATHHAVEVLPLVPVTAMTVSCALGDPMNALASGPVLALRSRIDATSARSSPSNAAAPSASTRQALAPAVSACATNFRPSTA